LKLCCDNRFCSLQITFCQQNTNKGHLKVLNSIQGKPNLDSLDFSSQSKLNPTTHEMLASTRNVKEILKIFHRK